MKEEHEDDEYTFEEGSLYDSEWFEYSIYSIAIIAIGFFIPPLLTFNPNWEIVAESLQKSSITVGLGSLFFCIYKLVREEGLLAKEQSSFGLLQNDDENIVDLSQYRLKNEKTVFDIGNVSNQTVDIRHFPKKLTQQILDEMEWRRFEQLCSAYFTQQGVKNALTGLGADGGIDIRIFDEQTSNVISIVQCKRFNNPVSVKLIREFYGVMSSQGISNGFFITTSTFHKNAVEFASNLNVELIDGKELLKRFAQLPLEAQTKLYELATHGDYKTPTCVKCGAKMIQRNNKKTGDPFWACRKYGCKSTLRIKSN